MKAFLTVTALIEGPTGLVLLAAPSALAWLLFATALDTPAAQAVGRVAGAALLSLALACGLARNQNAATATGTIAPMLLYNVAAVIVLAATGLGSGRSGIGLWPAIAVHVAMAGWCGFCLRAKRGQEDIHYGAK